MTDLRKLLLPALAAAALAGCGSDGGNPNSATDQASNISQDPFGATGAPGADMSDNGSTDGASGMADGNGAGNASDGNAAMGNAQ